MKQQSTKLFFVILLLVVFIVPSVALAAWWNPLSWNWNIFNWFSGNQISMVQTNQNITQQANDNKPACVPENGRYAAPETSADLCCDGLVQQPDPQSQSGTTGTCVKPGNQTTGWKTYTNTKYGFLFQYPNNYGLYSRLSDTDLSVANILSPIASDSEYIYLAKSGSTGQNFTNAILHIEVDPIDDISHRNIDSFEASVKQIDQSNLRLGQISVLPQYS